MNLLKKKQLAAKTLRVGIRRVSFNTERLNEIKEAITRQDISALHSEGAISIKPVAGRKKNVKRKTRRGPGKIKKKINRRKEEYVAITRKLRAYVARLRERNSITRDLYYDLRKKIRMRDFKSYANLKEHLDHLRKIRAEGIVEEKKIGEKK